MAPKPKKSRKESRPGPLRPGPRGGMLRVGGTNPNAGRPPDEFKRHMAAIASSDATLDFLKDCAKGKYGEAVAIRAMEYAAERGYGKVPSVTKIEGGDEPLTIRIVQE